MAFPGNSPDEHCQAQIARTRSINLLAPGLHALAPQRDGFRFIPQFCYLHLRTMSGGALTTAPTVRIGNNVGRNNVAPNFTPPLGVNVDALGVMPLASPLRGLDMADGDLLFEVAVAAVGPSAMTCDVILIGVWVK